MLKVEVVFVSATKDVFQCALDLPSGACVRDALIQSGLYEVHPEVKSMTVGIFAKPVTLETALKDQDRVEVYRALTHDPKDSRRLKQKQSRARK